MNTNKTNMTNKSSKLIAILILICIMISSLCMGCQKEVDGIAVKDSTARKILLAIRENNFSEANPCTMEDAFRTELPMRSAKLYLKCWMIS